MLGASTKFELYEIIKTRLYNKGCKVNPYREINYGLQFLVFYQSQDALLRIYESKKGLRVDYSQIKNEALLSYIQSTINEDFSIKVPESDLKKDTKDVEKLLFSDSDPEDLIGIDESGKGDYFGPLVIAGVRMTPELTTYMENCGVTDSKKLSPTAIKHLATKIKQKTQHAVIIMGNESYNEIYEKFQNLNHILAWAHMKVLEDTLKQGYCPNVLCDQFANPSLLKKSLQAKKLNVKLYQRPKAETNIAVACASILARQNFVEQLENISSSYKLTIPKGSTKNAVEAALNFVKEYGRDELRSVCKLHFNVTQKVDSEIKK